MIAPLSEGMRGKLERPATEERVQEFFRPGGALSRGVGHGADFAYESRPQQLEMATAVAQALAGGEHLFVEAGTGVGKSFAYLVPLVMTALETGRPVVVSTHTISLQEQLMYKDIPALRTYLGVDFSACLVKGRSNYLCWRRLGMAERGGNDLFNRRQADELARIRRWAEYTADGSLSDLVDQPSDDLWGRICAEQGSCTGRRCPRPGRCHLQKARARARDSLVLVVNHHLFFSELALRQVGAPFLPDYRQAVLDEAHHVEAVACEHYGIRVAQAGLEHWLRRLYAPDTRKGLLAMLHDDPGMAMVEEFAVEVERFFAGVAAWAAFSESDASRQKPVPSPGIFDSSLDRWFARVDARLHFLCDGLDDDQDVRIELDALRARGAGTREMLAAFLSQAEVDHVYWVEGEGPRRRLVLRSAPIEVGGVLRRDLFDEFDCVVATSATLAAGGNVDFCRRRLGADECRTMVIGSPFDYGRQMRVYVAPGMPDPNNLREFVPQCARAIEHFVRMTRGGAMALFTSTKVMKEVASLLEGFFIEEGLTAFVQGAGLSRHMMLERFKEDEHSVLLGLDSFWMGVDVPGDSLRNVIITRLPFSVPDHPVTRARTERIKENGGDPFRDYSLPEAILKFRQGVGRLIRTATDEGIVAILDNRIATKGYGRKFLATLEDCAIEEVSIP